MKNSKIEDLYILSPMQEGMLFHALYAPESDIYFRQLSYTIHGDLNIDAFERAWQRVIDLHPVLRASFHWEDLEKPLQMVHRRVLLPLKKHDWRSLPTAEQEQRLEALIAAETKHRFDLSQAPLMRLVLIRIADTACHFIWNYHHLLMDGWSKYSVIKEVMTLYEAYRKGSEVMLEPRRPFKDYIAWLRQQKQSDAESFWRLSLKGFRAPTPLAGVQLNGHGAGRYALYDERQLELSAAATATLQAFARRGHLTMSVLLQGAWALLLSRYSGEDDVIFGITVSGRPASLHGVDEMIGLFINTLPMRIEVPPHAALLTWLKGIQARQTELSQYEHCSLAEIQGWSEAPRGQPLFESLFVFDNYPVDPISHAHQSLSFVHLGTVERNNYPLTLVAGINERLILRLAYDTARFEIDAIDRRLGHLRTLLEGMPANQEQRLCDLPWLTEAERDRLLVELNRAQIIGAAESTIHQAFERQVERTPDATAVEYGDGWLSYRELNRRANQLAGRLCQLRVGPETPVGLYVERAPEMIVGLLGILKSGGVYAPLDPAYPPERLSLILEALNLPVLLTQQHLLFQLPPSAAAAELVCLDSDWEIIEQESDKNTDSQSTAENLAYIIYTSGSTGDPKGIGIPHGAAVNHLQAARLKFNLDEDDRALQFASMSFDVSLEQILAPLFSGATVVLRDRETWGQEEFWRQVYIRSLTVINVPPAYWRQLIPDPEKPHDPGAARQVKLIIIGGDAVLPEMARRWQQSPLNSNGIRLLNAYGPTETVITATTYEIPLLTTDGAVQRPLSIGRALGDRRIYILDGSGNQIPIGVAGELHIGGPLLARGYLHLPELTAEKFIPDPFNSEPGARMYRTGDVASYRSDDNLEFWGRTDHQVKVRGFRIELGEIEAALATYGDLREVAVIIKEHEDGDKRLVAYVVIDQPLAINQLKDHLRQKLPEYMIPSAFVMLDELPITPNGKIDRRALVALDPPSLGPEDSFVAPRTEVEMKLAEIWRQALGLERVGIHDNFFELGGDSILSLQIAGRANQAGLAVTLKDLFQYPTIAEIVAAISLNGETSAHRRDAATTETSSSGRPLDTAILGQITRERPEVEDIYRLTPLQQGMLFHSLYEPGSGAYITTMSWRVQGDFDIELFERAWRQLIDRHAILRTSFFWARGDDPLQVVHRKAPLSLRRENWRELSGAERQQRLEDHIRAESSNGFDMATAPLLRISAMQIADDTHYVVWTHHHILTDGWSMTLMIKELFAFYQAGRQGWEAQLASIRPFRDYIEWLERQDAQKAKTYWRELLRDFSAPTTLEVKQSAHSLEPSSEPAELELRLSENLVSRLQSFAARHRLTANTLIQGAWALLLNRYSGETDVLFGATVSGRPAELAGVDEMIGLFINTLPVRVRIDPRQKAPEWLLQLQEQVLETRQYEYSSLIDVQGWSGVERGVPLFESIVVFENHPVDASFELQIEQDLQLRIEGGRVTDRPDYPLALVVGIRGGFRLRLIYDHRRFEAETIERILKLLQALIAGLISEEPLTLSQLPRLTDEERQRLLVEWNQAVATEVKGEPLHRLFEAQVKCTPSAIAVCYRDQHLSYRELNDRTNRLARLLRRHGVGPESLVGLCLRRSAEMVISMLAILKAGGAYVPLDADFPMERLTQMLEDSGLRVLITDRESAKLSPTNGIKVIDLDREQEALACESHENMSAWSGEMWQIAYVIYTSGSTGKPKGVQVTHGALINFLVSMSQAPGSQAPGMTGSDRLLAVTTLSFDIAGLEIFLPLLGGARLIIADRDVAMDAVQLMRSLDYQNVTVMQATPATWQMLIEAGWTGDEQLRLLCGGDTLSSELAAKLRRRSAGLWNLYGPTETTIWSTIKQVTDNHEAPTIGRPIANTEIYILDPGQQPAPLGVIGELYIGGAGVARSYLNRPELTAEKFIPHAYGKEAGARLYRTGDWARYRSDGDIEFLGRRDHQVKVRGYRIELGEIETALRQHADVQQAVVMASESAPGEKRLIAYLVTKQKTELSEGELRRHLKARLPEYMIPSAFIHLEAMPLTLNGKVDRGSLAKNSPLRSNSAGPHSIPRNAAEEILCGIFEEVLKIEAVKVEDNFFELGGHSLLATRVMNRVRDAFGINPPLRRLFDAPTVAAFSQAVEEARREWREPLPLVRAVSRDRALPLSYAQQRLWFNEQVSPGSQVYHVPATMRLDGELSVRTLEESLSEIVRRHEALRTHFSQADGQPVQVILPPYELILSVTDLSLMAADERERQASRLVAEEMQKPFNLERGPLFRARLLKLAEQQHIFIVNMHHIITDGWSMGILVRELTALYDARLRGQAWHLDEPVVQYADFAVWQREWLQGEVLEKHLSYWRRQLEGAPPVLELPTDFPRPEAQSFRGAKRAVTFSKTLTEELKTYSRQRGVTLFMTLLAAFQTLLRYHTDCDDLVVGTDDANREYAETEDLIGFFINQLALRVDLSGNPHFDELLGRVREVTLDAYAHRSVPFEEIVRALNPGRSMKHTPIFQVKIVLQNMPSEELELPGLTLNPVLTENVAAKFDLTPLLRDGPDGLGGWFEYNRDLFKASTVDHFARQLEIILAGIVERPEITLDDLNERLTEFDRRRQAAEQQEREAIRRKKLGTIKPREIDLTRNELVTVSLLKEGENLPLVIQPVAEKVDLTAWADGNRDFITAKLAKHGAILFRGFDVHTSTRFEQFAASISPDLFNENGEHPRGNVSGNIYTPVFYPPDKQLLWHNENSFNRRWPMKIWFYCAQPAAQGGETPLVDSRLVFNLIDPRIRDRFLKKGVKYVRNYGHGVGLDWQTVLRTNDKVKAEEYFRLDLMEFDWKADGRLRTGCVRPAAARHPRTGEFVWFNQAQHWHLSCLDPETRAAIMAAYCEEDYPRNCYYGDGSPIEDSVMQEILEVYSQLEVSFPWQQRDIVMLDNMLAAHGRNPFTGERKLFVAMGEMMNYEEIETMVAD